MKKPIIYFLYFLSGIAGLGYEILWTRMLSVSLGHEFVSVLAVVSAFFAGLALGAWLLDKPISRSTNPGKWYAGFELIIMLWAVALLFILPSLDPVISRLIGLTPSPLRHWVISFLYPLVILLPATVAMGGTLPAMDRILEKLADDGKGVAGLYSVNTLGAVAGTLAMTFFFLPSLGMNTSAMFLVAVNYVCAAGIIIFFRTNTGYKARYEPVENLDVPIWHLYLILLVTGFLGIGFEVLIVRVLSQALENTIFSFADMLMVFLFGTAIGAAVYQKVKKSFDFGHGLSIMLLLTAFFCLISIFALQYIEPVFQAVKEFYGKGFKASIAAEISIALLFFLLPTISMGATFSHLAQSLKGREGGVGRALCLNTLGGALAPFCFGVLLLPEMGIKLSLLLIPVLYVLCIPRIRRPFVLAATSLILLAVFIAQDPESYRFVTLSKGDTIVYHKDGVMASVSVIKDSSGGLHLKVNNRFQMGGTTSVFSDRRQSFFPLLLHPDPKKALFLGLGTGTTFATAANLPDLDATGVELVPEVIDAIPHFEKVTGDLSKFSNLHIINADARRYINASDSKYDVIIADLFHPARDGAASLYTMEHFQAIKNALEDNGLFCQWLPLYQLDIQTLKIITRTFMEVFPDGQAYLAHYSVDQPIIGLIGGRQKLRFPENWYDKRVRGASFKKAMFGYGYDSIYSLLGTFLAGGDTLKNFSAGSPVNTDENPVVLFKAPSFVYGQPSPPKERLLALLNIFSHPDPEEILSEVVTEEDFLARPKLKSYWNARNSFLEVGAHTQRTNDPVTLYRDTSDALLKIVRKSSDFSAAYFPLLSIAYDIYPADKNASLDLLGKLERANPQRFEAHILKSRLFGNVQ